MTHTFPGTREWAVDSILSAYGVIKNELCTSEAERDKIDAESAAALRVFGVTVTDEQLNPYGR